MSRRPQTRGKCDLCGQEIAKGGVGKHLAACTEYQAAIAKAEAKGGVDQDLYHLRIQARALPQFWLDLEMRGGAKLKDLDDYLRSIWLECCGHLSRFSYGGWGEDDIPMSRKLSDAVEVGGELTHQYDFGSTSETVVKVVGIRQGKPLTPHPITLLVRNLQPEALCIECEKPAKWLCMECMIEEDVWGTLCDEHAEDHPHEDYGEPIELVNSPRMGICGYEGPAEPPY